MHYVEAEAIAAEPIAAAASNEASKDVSNETGWGWGAPDPNDKPWRNTFEWWGVYDESPPAFIVWALKRYSFQRLMTGFPGLYDVCVITGALQHIATYAEGPILNE